MNVLGIPARLVGIGVASGVSLAVELVDVLWPPQPIEIDDVVTGTEVHQK